jgi:predicted nucleic acid-binding protein
LYVVDASVWVSRFIDEDRFHMPSREWLESTMLTGNPIFEPVLLLPEVAGPLARRSGNTFMARLAIQAILQTPGVSLVEVDRQGHIAAAHLAADLQLKGADSVYVAVAEAHGCELVTWDKTQLERASSRILVRRPSDLLAAQRGSA